MTRILILCCFLFSEGYAQIQIDDLFFIHRASREQADSLLSAKGYTSNNADLKTGLVKGGSYLWRDDVSWVEGGVQTLFEYQNESSRIAVGFYWNRRLQRIDDLGMVTLSDYSINLMSVVRKHQLIELEFMPDSHLYADAARDFFLLVDRGMGNQGYFIKTVRRDSATAKLFSKAKPISKKKK